MLRAIRKSSRNGGKGIIIAITMARTPAGTSKSSQCGSAAAVAGLDGAPAITAGDPALWTALGTAGSEAIGLEATAEPSIRQAINISEHLGHRTVERRGYLLADFGGPIERPSQRWV